MSVITDTSDAGLWRKFFPLFVAIVMLGGFAWGIYAAQTYADERDRTEYVVTYFPKNGDKRVYDGVHHLQLGRANTQFVYMGKLIELKGDVEIVRKN